MGKFNPVRILQMLFTSIKAGGFIPFIIHSKTKIKIRNKGKSRFIGRVHCGTPSHLARISVNAVNIYIGKNAELSGGHSVVIGPGVNIILKDDSKINIGSGTYFTSDSHIESVHQISIGENCAISWGVTIIDSDHHKIKSGAEKDSQPLLIGNHVWIGCNTTILKNSVIGNNCIIASGSVVKGTFPDNCLIGGNPARIIKEQVDWK